jgi:mannitol-1-phosphate 5-dehydrogenase
MKIAVHFGAGKIGRGFIADLLHDSGYDVIFVDVTQPLIDMINAEHQYNLFLIDHDYEEKVIDHVKAYSSITDPNRVIESISKAEIVTTSVMATNLAKLHLY